MNLNVKKFYILYFITLNIYLELEDFIFEILIISQISTYHGLNNIDVILRTEVFLREYKRRLEPI